MHDPEDLSEDDARGHMGRPVSPLTVATISVLTGRSDRLRPISVHKVRGREVEEVQVPSGGKYLRAGGGRGDIYPQSLGRVGVFSSPPDSVTIAIVLLVKERY
jgi:hypothetical protein